MKKSVMQREYKKIKGQVNQIEEIVHNSKFGALHEHEVSVRKKIKQLNDMKDEGFKDFNIICERYDEVLEYISKRILEDYNKKNNTDFDYYDVVRQNYNMLLNSGILGLLITKHIPKLISKEFERVFPLNPKDEYIKARTVKRKFYIHLGDTNTGKTYNAMQRLKTARKGVYLSPLRILALENFERLNSDGVVCNLLTGEEEIINLEATHISCTIEKLNLNKEYDIGVIDEIQMIDDCQRGAAWSRALLGLKCKEIHVCGALNTKDILITILKDCSEDFEIELYKRDIPLIVEHSGFTYKDTHKGDALVLFSKKRVLELAQYYSSIDIKTSIIYGDLPPEVRKKQYDAFINKENKILITTDAIGMGVNLPIKRIIFLDIKKFDGDEVRLLKSQEVKQIAGRAGRKGIYDIGYIASVGNNSSFIEEKLEEEDEIIKEAVIGPSEAILQIESLSLREKLALWSARQEKLSYYRKMDISEYLIVLDRIKSYKLKQNIEWNLLKIPFDVSKGELMEQFLIYVDQLFIAKQDEISRPECYIGNLEDLENYYQRINMYYSFCKIFNLEFDFNWIYEERLKISKEINEILIRI